MALEDFSAWRERAYRDQRHTPISLLKGAEYILSRPQTGTIEMTDPTREEIDAKIEASEARTDTKMAHLEGKIDLVISKLDSSISETRQMRADVKDDSRATRANQWVIFFGLAGIIIASLALIVAFFTLGTQFRDVIHAEVHAEMPHILTKH
jgi:hypothetical protein